MTPGATVVHLHLQAPQPVGNFRCLVSAPCLVLSWVAFNTAYACAGLHVTECARRPFEKCLKTLLSSPSPLSPFFPPAALRIHALVVQDADVLSWRPVLRLRVLFSEIPLRLETPRVVLDAGVPTPTPAL